MLAKNLVLLEANKSNSSPLPIVVYSIMIVVTVNVDYCACSKNLDHVLFLFFCPRFCIGTEVSCWKAFKLPHPAMGRAGTSS